MSSATLRPGNLARAAAALTACLLVGGTATAHAAEAADAPPSVRVNYRDLNIATEQGSLELYGRIVAAAHRLCAARDIRILSEVMAARACEEHAIEQAVRDVNSPQLAATYSAHQRRHG